MSDPTRDGKSFKSNIENLFDELQLAFEWGRPSLLLVIHKSRAAEHKARQALTQKLQSDRRKVVEIELGEERPDVLPVILHSGNLSDTVFFVSGLDQSGGTDGKDGYRALNLGRELLVENRVKLVLWLTLNEASSLPRLAPDFWAFRHRVIEFASPALHLSGKMLSRLLMWHDGELLDPPDDLQEKILNYERVVGELPDNLDSLAMRIESLYLLGHAYWAAGRSDDALRAFISGNSLAQHDAFSDMRTWLLNGVAITRHEQGEYPQVLKIYEGLSQLSPNDGILSMNWGIALCSTGKNYDGITESRRATAKEPSNPKLWNRLGHLQLAVGKFDDAMAAFRKAIAIAPSQAEYSESLAICHAVMGNIDDALIQIRKAGQLEDEPYPRSELLEEAIRGETEKAADLLKAAIRAGQISETTAKRDPNLCIVIDDALFS